MDAFDLETIAEVEHLRVRAGRLLEELSRPRVWVQTVPTSVLPSDPKARRAHLSKMYLLGLISAEDALRLEASGPPPSPEHRCPRCDREAAPEHVERFAERQEKVGADLRLYTVEVHGYRCKCWWCEHRWEESNV